MAIQVTMENVFSTADALVAEKGEDYRYDFPSGGKSCWNVWNDKPSCIVGTILHRLGVPVEKMQGNNSGEFADRMGMGASDLTASLAEDGTIDFIDGSVLDALRFMQREQDGGATWAESVSIARRRVKEFYFIEV